MNLYGRQPNPWRRFVVPACVAGALLTGTTLFMFSSSRSGFAAPMSNPVFATAMSGWQVIVQGEAQPGSKLFGGHLAPGGVLYLPAGAPFDAVVEPVGAKGTLVPPPADDSWDHEGGELNLGIQTADGWRQEGVAPSQPGLYHLLWKDAPAGKSIPAFDVLVLARAEMQKQGDRTLLKVNGKPLGAYLDPSQSTLKRVRENAGRYLIPRYFATLNSETAGLKLGDDFNLSQLIAFKDYYGPDGKKIITNERHTDVLPLRPELIEKLVKLRERLRAKGVKVTRFWITSGFRTPAYNHSIGGVAYSRHCYGDAVDLCIDEDGDKHMDDLNGDGKIDRKDGLVIANACRELEAEGAVVPGGIGVYEWDSDDSVRSHVHIDCRGFITRWGQIGSGKYKKSFTWWPRSEYQEDDAAGD